MEEPCINNCGRSIAFGYVNQCVKNERLSGHNARIIKRYLQVKFDTSNETIPPARLLARTLVSFVDCLDVDITQATRRGITDALDCILCDTHNFLNKRKLSIVQDFLRYSVFADFISVERVGLNFIDSLVFKYSIRNRRSISGRENRIGCENCHCPTRSQ